MEGLRSLDVRIDYSGPGHALLTGFVLPALSQSSRYDRITSFFTTDSLVAIAAGLDELYQRGGRMRLVIGLHDVPVDLATAASGEGVLAEAIDAVRERVLAEVSRLSDELARDRLSTLAWMLRDGFLKVRVAAVRAEDPGIFHNKAMVFRDAFGDVIAAVGSPNETSRGLGGNFEHLTVFTSWEAQTYTEAQERFFEDLWMGRLEGLCLDDLDASFASDLLDALGDGKPKEVVPQARSSVTLGDLVSIAKQMPAFSLVSGNHAALFPHQECAFLDALSRWPLRVLLADEVGLGKTFEAGAVISFMMRFAQVASVVVLAPKAVVLQWQGELKEHFSIDAWVFDSARRAYISPEGSVRALAPGESPVGKSRPRVCIISSQYARGSRQNAHLFDADSAMPDLLVVDEAHSARMRPDLSGSVRPTLMWRLLDELARRVPHLVLASATPMQVHWREYHALLRLLGLPTAWRRPETYERSLHLVTLDQAPSDLQAGADAARMILCTLSEMSPCLDGLTDEERAHLEELQKRESDTVNLSEYALASWNLTRNCLVKTHPAHQLTVRNTRGSLELMGYQFPERNLVAPPLHAPASIRAFYLDIDDYLSDVYFEVERALYPDRRFNVGFVKCNYQQRLASSLTACKVSLERRRERLFGLIDDVSATVAFIALAEEQADDPDSLDDAPSLCPDELGAYDRGEVLRLARIEAQYIDGLLARLDALLAGGGDPKIAQTMAILEDTVAAGDQVLVFSRFTDTLEAVVRAFLNKIQPHVGYGVFTGERATLDLGAGLRSATRTGIRDALASGSARVIFCSDAASEGLNLQAARVLVNVDVPWNPARLEQRIGRIARLGQTAACVDIFNIWYPDSIEAQMYERLARRKDLYDIAVGEYPDVIADSIRAEVSTRLGVPRSTEDPVEALQKLRREVQLVALRRLWSRETPALTQTAAFRESLIDVICSVAASRGADVSRTDSGVELILDRERFTLATEAGSGDAVSLSCDALARLADTPVPDTGGVVVACTVDERPASFAWDGDDGLTIRPLDFPAMLHWLTTRDGEKTPPTSERPTWLPSPDRLNVPVERDTAPATAPSHYWPPTGTLGLKSEWGS